MRMILVGADFEENLGVAMIAAAAEEAGRAVQVIPFNDASQISRVATSLVGSRPDVVGLSMQFQHRAHDFVTLARLLRAGGYRGHVTCGGQFPTLAWRELLGHDTAVDSVVLHDGERTIVELLAALQEGRSLRDVPGLALRGDDGEPLRTAPRAMPQQLDALPFAQRYRSHSRHMGIPFVPMMGSRGCWGACAFCAITSFYRDARAYAGGPTLRHRSPENVAAEMALRLHAVGGSAVFCFHDDSFLLPRPAATLARVRAIRTALDGYGVTGRVGIVGKARPDSITADLARQLAELDVIRLYVGVENVSAAGAAHLNRSAQTARVREALQACREAGIFGCYNLLLFEPDATLDDVEENLGFIREHAAHPVNFCRAEPYIGTPLQQRMAAEGRLGGSYLGFDYRIADDRTELLFRICAAAFRQRNFDSLGLHNRIMGLGYDAKLLEHFYDDSGGRRPPLLHRARDLSRAIVLETAGFLEEALELARSADLADRDRIERETALLGLRIAAADRCQHVQLDELYAAMHAFAAGAEPPRVALRSPASLAQAAKRLAQGVALGTLLAAWSAAPMGCDDRSTPTDAGVYHDDPVPPDGMVRDADPVPPDSAIYDPLPPDGMVADMLPPDRGVYLDDPAPDAMIADPPPPDAGLDAMVADMLPPDQGVDAMVADPLPADQPAPDPWGGSASLAPGGALGEPSLARFRDTSPRRALRSRDLPLFEPPALRLEAQGEARGVRVRLIGGPEALSTRWESDGAIEGEGREVLWIPEADTDQLRVGARSHGGVAVLALRARDVTG